MIDMPPRRTLPQQTRDKILVDLRSKMDEKPRRSRTPYAVAAGVAALVAGGVVVATTVHGDPGVGTASGKVTGDTKGVQAEALRCRDAAKKVGGFPAGADWKVATHTALAGYTELAIRVADKPVFCEVTATSVTLSKYDTKPNYVASSKTGNAFQGASGLVGLVVDPSWHGIDAYEKDGDREVLDSEPQEGTVGWRYADGMALWWPEYQVPLTVAPHGKKPTSPLPKAPDSTVTVVDRPNDGPPPDRTSPAGKLLAGCIERDAKAGFSLPEPDTWQAGPLLTGDTAAIVVMRGIQQVTTCTGDGIPNIGLWGGKLRVTELPKGNQPAVSVAGLELVRNHERRDIVFGSAPMNAASMTLTTREHKTVTAQVSRGMFIADVRQIPEVFTENDTVYPVITSVTVKDAHGKVLYHGKPATNVQI